MKGRNPIGPVGLTTYLTKISTIHTTDYLMLNLPTTASPNNGRRLSEGSTSQWLHRSAILNLT